MSRQGTELVIIPTFAPDMSAETELLRGLLKRRKGRDEVSSDAVTPEPDALSLDTNAITEKSIAFVRRDISTDASGSTSSGRDA